MSFCGVIIDERDKRKRFYLRDPIVATGTNPGVSFMIS
jgi:hypothetical protein